MGAPRHPQTPLHGEARDGLIDLIDVRLYTSEMSFQKPHPSAFLAAARALFRAPQAEDACWADVHMPDGTVRACGRPEATNLGLCGEHRIELFGLEAS